MQAKRLAVWACVWSEGVIERYCFDGMVAGQSYLPMLNDYFSLIYRDLSDTY